MTEKMRKFSHPRLKYLQYEKITPDKDSSYEIKEWAKVINFNRICKLIQEVIDNHNITSCVMEGISYGSVGSAALADLAGLNFSIRKAIYDRDIRCKIVSPNSVKSFATGRGNAPKETMIDTWMHCDPAFNDVKVKVDDVADSYFMAHMD